jgi:hypothetical protein
MNNESRCTLFKDVQLGETGVGICIIRRFSFLIVLFLRVWGVYMNYNCPFIAFFVLFIQPAADNHVFLCGLISLHSFSETQTLS